MTQQASNDPSVSGRLVAIASSEQYGWYATFVDHTDSSEPPRSEQVVAWVIREGAHGRTSVAGIAPGAPNWSGRPADETPGFVGYTWKT